MDIVAFNGFMVLLYDAMEKMNKEDRKFLLKSVKEARKLLDFKYPEGRPEKDAVVPVPSATQTTQIPKGS